MQIIRPRAAFFCRSSSSNLSKVDISASAQRRTNQRQSSCRSNQAPAWLDLSTVLIKKK